MSDYIKREDVLRLIRDRFTDGRHDLECAIASLPSAPVSEERESVRMCEAAGRDHRLAYGGLYLRAARLLRAPQQQAEPVYVAPPPDDEAVRLIAQFGAWCLDTHREDFGDLDGGSVQDEAQRLGILVNVPVTEPCGESCNCAEYDDFPQDCLRYSEPVRAYISRMEKP